jgi:hypothetical protein
MKRNCCPLYASIAVVAITCGVDPRSGGQVPPDFRDGVIEQSGGEAQLERFEDQQILFEVAENLGQARMRIGRGPRCVCPDAIRLVA